MRERERKKKRERKSKKDYKMGNAYKKFSVVWLGHNKIYFGKTNIKITFVMYFLMFIKFKSLSRPYSLGEKSSLAQR